MPEEETKDDVKQEGAETTDESSTSEDGKTIPYGRFQEVVQKKNEAEARIKELEQKKSDGDITPEQKKELDAKTYLKNLQKETWKEMQAEMEKEKSEKTSKFQTDVDDAVTKNPGVKKDDFLKFVEKNGDDFASVASAMKHYRATHEISKEAAEKAKREIDRKPGLPSSEGGASDKSGHDDKGKSLSQIAEEVLRGR